MRNGPEVQAMASPTPVLTATLAPGLWYVGTPLVK